MHPRRSAPSSLVRKLGSHAEDTYIEFGVRGPIAKPLPLALDFTHRRVRESTADGSSHDGQAFEVTCQIRVFLK
jgi:hypothetical protein